MADRGCILVLWNQTEEDVYERWRRDGPRPLSWDPTRLAPDVGTVQEELDAMLDALREGGFDVRCVNVEDEIDRLIGAIRFHRPDAVFNLIEYFNEDNFMETSIVGLYELFGTPYTGCSARSLLLCQDKHRAKVLLEAAGLPTADFIRVDREPVPDPEEQGLTYPLIVKPSLEDASGGIEPASVVHSYAQLQERVRHALKEFEQALVVEEYIEGREIHAALLGNDPPEVLPLFEMEFDDSEFNPEGEWRPQIISFKAKWDPHSQVFYSMDAVVPPQDLDESIEARIRDVAVKAFKTMECRDYARIDMRVDEEGEVYILEVNPNPDLADGAAYMQCATASGRSFSDALCEIADMAVERGREWERKASERGEAPMDQLLLEYTKQEAERAAGGGAALAVSGGDAADAARGEIGAAGPAGAEGRAHDGASEQAAAPSDAAERAAPEGGDESEWDEAYEDEEDEEDWEDEEGEEDEEDEDDWDEEEDWEDEEDDEDWEDEEDEDEEGEEDEEDEEDWDEEEDWEDEEGEEVEEDWEDEQALEEDQSGGERRDDAEGAQGGGGAASGKTRVDSDQNARDERPARGSGAPANGEPDAPGAPGRHRTGGGDAGETR